MGFKLTEPDDIKTPRTARPTICPYCQGRKLVGDKRCICLLTDQLAIALEPFGDLAPLVEKDAKGRVTSFEARGENALSRRNVLWEGPWEHVGRQVRHLVKEAIIEAAEQAKPFAYRLVTDAELVEDAFEDRRLRREDDDPLTSPALRLVIVRMGYLGFKNAAAAGIIAGHLKARHDARRWTWVVLDSDAPKPLHGWDKNLDKYVVEARYTRIAWS